jgi:hypothetical protein
VDALSRCGSSPEASAPTSSSTQALETPSTMQRYAHLDPATIRAVVELLALRDGPTSRSESGGDSGTAALDMRSEKASTGA